MSGWAEFRTSVAEACELVFAPQTLSAASATIIMYVRYVIRPDQTISGCVFMQAGHIGPHYPVIPRANAICPFILSCVLSIID